MEREDETPIQIPLGNPKDQAVTKPPSERFKTYAQGLALLIPALGGLALGIIGTWKGGSAEDVADKAKQAGLVQRKALWIKLRDKVNEQSKVINKLHVRMVAIQARQEGQTAGRLQAQLADLQRRYEALAKRRAYSQRLNAIRTGPPRSGAAQPAPSPKTQKLIPQLPESYRKGK